MSKDASTVYRCISRSKLVVVGYHDQELKAWWDMYSSRSSFIMVLSHQSMYFEMALHITRLCWGKLPRHCCCLMQSHRDLDAPHDYVSCTQDRASCGTGCKQLLRVRTSVRYQSLLISNMQQQDQLGLEVHVWCKLCRQKVLEGLVAPVTLVM